MFLRFGRAVQGLEAADERMAKARAKVDGDRLEELKQEGWQWRKGMVWGRGDCLADSLLQLLIHHLVLPAELQWEMCDGRWERDRACEANRRHLCEHEDMGLRPRTFRGVEDRRAYLEHDRHGEEIISFFMNRYSGRRLRELPRGGIQLIVKTRYDSMEGYALQKRICADRVGTEAGPPLVFVLYCWSTGDGGGYHYDVLCQDGAGGGVRGVVFRGSRPKSTDWSWLKP